MRVGEEGKGDLGFERGLGFPPAGGLVKGEARNLECPIGQPLNDGQCDFGTECRLSGGTQSGY